jgi:hypothetical protein
MRGEAKVTLPQAYWISLPCDTSLWTHTVYMRVLFRLHVSFCLWWMAKLSNMSASSFTWSSVNLIPKPLWNALLCFWRTFFKPDNGFWMAFTFKDWPSVSWRWQTFRVTKHHQNDRKCLKNSRTHPRRLSLNNPWLSDIVVINYGVYQEILTENLNMRHIAANLFLRSIRKLHN